LLCRLFELAQSAASGRGAKPVISDAESGLMENGREDSCWRRVVHRRCAEISDGRSVNLNYDLADAADVEDVLSELIGLIRDGALSPDASTYPAP